MASEDSKKLEKQDHILIDKENEKGNKSVHE